MTADPSSVIILYSKYSAQCKRLLQLASIPSGFTMVCVDNARIRQRLLQSKKLNIRHVPCVLLSYPDGKLEKFEDTRVADWLMDQFRTASNTGYSAGTAGYNAGTAGVDMSHTMVAQPPYPPEQYVPQAPLQAQQDPSGLPIVSMPPERTSLEFLDQSPLPLQQPQLVQEPQLQRSAKEIAAEMALAREQEQSVKPQTALIYPGDNKADAAPVSQLSNMSIAERAAFLADSRKVEERAIAQLKEQHQAKPL